MLREHGIIGISRIDLKVFELSLWAGKHPEGISRIDLKAPFKLPVSLWGGDT